MNELEGKSALVTGGTRGIGRAILFALAAKGADVAFSYHFSQAEAEAILSELEQMGVRAKAIRSDQADPAAAQQLVDTVVEAFGRLDILVNNAGIANLGRVGEGHDYAALDRVWAVNTMGVIATIRAAAHVLADGGRIITIGSVSGSKSSHPGSADYCGSKAAIAGYTRGVAHDLATRRITANVIESGMMNSDMALGMPEADQVRIKAGIPLARFGELSEISGLVPRRRLYQRRDIDYRRRFFGLVAQAGRPIAAGAVTIRICPPGCSKIFDWMRSRAGRCVHLNPKALVDDGEQVPYPHVDKPIRLGNLEVKDRTFRPAHGMDYVNPSVGSCNRNDKMIGGMNEPVGYTVVLVSSNRQIRDVFEALRNRLADMRIVGDASSPRYVQTAICRGHLASAAVRLTWRDARCQARKQ